MDFSAASGVSFLMLSVFAILALGYLLGRITIKGISLGSAGVFIVALVYGCLFYSYLSDALTVVCNLVPVLPGQNPKEHTYVVDALKIVENLGLMLFVTAVGFIAGPNFISNFKKNFKSYVLLGFVIIAAGALTCVGCILIGQNFTELSLKELAAMMVGIFAGALTSTPAFSAAKGSVESAELESIISTGYGIAYLFGVIGVVLFVQLMPKILKANVEEERAKIKIADTGRKGAFDGKLIEMDDFGLMPFSLAIFLGIVLGSIKFGAFSLTTTGGCLVAGLAFGHFGRIGKINIMPDTKVLKVMRELGLVLFLLGAGVSGGSRFIELFQPVYFIYGMLITLVPMIAGFLIAKYVLKLPLFNNLGSITGGMTSTPALGTLINVSGTDDVASAYASTYPISLVAVILAAQLILIIFK